MIEQTMGTVAEFTAEQARDIARDAVREASHLASSAAERVRATGLVDKVIESDLAEIVRHEERKLRKRGRKLHKQGLKLRRQARGYTKTKKRSGVPRVAVFAALAGLAALAFYLRRRAQRDEMYEPGAAPDAFGGAVIEERASSNGGQPVATPGA